MPEDGGTTHPAMNALIEQDEVIVQAGPTYARMLGFTPPELLGMSISSLVAQSDRDRLRGYGRARSSGQEAPTRYNFQAFARDGRSVPVVASVRAATSAGSTRITTTIEPDIARLTSDSRSFSILYDFAAPNVNGLLTHMLGESTAANETLRETFLSAWDHRDGCGSGSVLPWILAIARDRAALRLRNSPPSVAVDVSGPLLGLPPEQAEALQLAYFGGLDAVTIADRLKTPVDVVRRRLVAGMRALREMNDSRSVS